MSNVMIAILFALGAGAWVYSKMYRRTGGNNKNAIIIGASVSLLVFVATIVLLGSFVNST